MQPLETPNLKKNESWLPAALTAICVAQPLLDVLSYWTQVTGRGNTASLLLRMLLLAATAVVAFVISNRKRVYWALAGVIVLFLAAHVAACLRVGYQSPVSDLTNFVRVIQLPIYTLAFITLFLHTDRFLEVLETAFAINLFLIAGVTLLSVLTGTCMPTYGENNVGFSGWFWLPNSQSAILGTVTVVPLLSAIRRRRWLLAAVECAVGFALLFFLGTRLAYAEIFCIALGSCICLLLTHQADKRAFAMILICAALCGALYHQSPMYQNRQIFSESVVEQQTAADALNDSEEDALDALYRTYQPVMVNRFGLEQVQRAFGYTDDISILGDSRLGKITYCKMIMAQLSVTSRLFGFELEATKYQGATFDVENDFHGIYFLYGIVGLVLMVGFLLWFAVRTLWRMFRDPANNLTLPVCAFGMAAVILVVNAYFSASVLRRPNASVYLSFVLAALYCLTTAPRKRSTGSGKELP